MGDIFSYEKILPKYSGRKNALGEILLYDDYYMGEIILQNIIWDK
jgi:hypothetical protein